MLREPLIGLGTKRAEFPSGQKNGQDAVERQPDAVPNFVNFTRPHGPFGCKNYKVDELSMPRLKFSQSARKFFDHNRAGVSGSAPPDAVTQFEERSRADSFKEELFVRPELWLL